MILFWFEPGNAVKSILSDSYMFDSVCSSSPSPKVSPALPWDNPRFIALVIPFSDSLPCFPDLLLHQSSLAGVCISTYACGPLHAIVASEMSYAFIFQAWILKVRVHVAINIEHIPVQVQS